MSVTLSLTPERLGELLGALLRARALESALSAVPGTLRETVRAPAPVSPSVPAAAALRRLADGRGDVFSVRGGSPAAALLFGLSPAELFRQVLGTRGARAGGRDPGGFPTDLNRGLIAPVSPPGELLEVLSGCALAFGLRDEARVALLVDGADDSASGAWHEALNLAAVRKAPFVLVVDAIRRGSATPLVPRIVDRAPAYGINGRGVDGGDPGAILAEVAGAVERARAGEGVQLVEVGPEGADVDPVDAVVTRLRWAGGLTADELQRADVEAVEDVLSGLAEAQRDPAPGAVEALVPGVFGREPLDWPWPGRARADEIRAQSPGSNPGERLGPRRAPSPPPVG